MAHGEYNHIEIPYDDEHRAKRFYTGVFGWQFSQIDGFPGYDLYTAGPGDLGGGLGKRGESAGNETRNYILVDSVEDAVTKIQELGGTITDPEERDPGHGLVRGRHRQRRQYPRGLRARRSLTTAAEGASATIRRCALLIPTVTCRRIPSTTTSSSSSTVPGLPASSGSSSLAGTPRRRRAPSS